MTNTSQNPNDVSFNKLCSSISAFCVSRGVHDSLLSSGQNWVRHHIKFRDLEVSILVSKNDDQLCVDFFSEVLPESALRSIHVHKAVLKYSSDLIAGSVYLLHNMLVVGHAFLVPNGILSLDAIEAAIRRLNEYVEGLQRVFFSPELNEHITGVKPLPLAS